MKQDDMILNEIHSIIDNSSFASNTDDTYEFARIHYHELIKYILTDLESEKQFLALIIDTPTESTHGETISDDMKKNFYQAFKSLIDCWHKYDGFSYDYEYPPETDTNATHLSNSWILFKTFFDQKPTLCKKIFPLVVFVIADNYYELCKKCSTDKKYPTISFPLSKRQKSYVCNYITDILSGSYKDYYLYSLIDRKASYYSETSIHEGKRIFNTIRKKINEHINSQDSEYDWRLDDMPLLSFDPYYELIKEDFEKDYNDRLNSVIKKRLKADTSSSGIVHLGENAIALFSFLDNLSSSNYWGKNTDMSLTIYAINYATCWLSTLMLPRDPSLNLRDPIYLGYTENSLVATLYYLSTNFTSYTKNEYLPGEFKEILENTFHLVSLIDENTNLPLEAIEIDSYIYEDIFGEYASYSDSEIVYALNSISELLCCLAICNMDTEA